MEIRTALACVIGYIAALVIYAISDIRSSKFAFIIWFPLVAIPITLFVLALPECMRSSSPGPGAPLSGAIDIFVGLVLIAGLTLSGVAATQRPTNRAAYRWYISAPTAVLYIAGVVLLMNSIKPA